MQKKIHFNLCQLAMLLFKIGQFLPLYLFEEQTRRICASTNRSQPTAHGKRSDAATPNTSFFPNFQCIAVMQCIAVCCSILQCVAVYCSVLLCAAVQPIPSIQNTACRVKRVELHVYTRTHKRTHTCTHTHTRTPTNSVAHTHTHTHTHTMSITRSRTSDMRTVGREVLHTKTQPQTNTYARTHVHTRTHAYTHTHTSTTPQKQIKSSRI